MAEHRIKWFVWAVGNGRKEKLPHTASMRGTWGYDAECSCGWQSRTGGAVKRSVENMVADHKLEVSLEGKPVEPQRYGPPSRLYRKAVTRAGRPFLQTYNKYTGEWTRDGYETAINAADVMVSIGIATYVNSE